MAALTLIAACVLIGSGETEIAADRGDPGWTSARGFLALAFLSASVGLQGAVAARLGTPFATTGACAAEPAQVSAAPVRDAHGRFGRSS